MHQNQKKTNPSLNFFSLGRSGGGWIGKAAFFILLISPQVNFIFPGVGKVLFGVGVFLFFLGWRDGRFVRYFFLKYIILFFVVFLMHVLLHFFGGKGDLPSRPLYLAGVATLVLIFSASMLTKAEDGWLFISRSIAICLIVEIFIVLSQFAYLTYGFGLPPKDDDSLLTGFLTGSYGNPNNVAVMITLQVFVLFNTGFVRRNPIFSLIVVFSAFFAVFFTLSRTCFVLFSIFLFMYFFLNKAGGVAAIRFVRVALGLTLVYAIFLFFNYIDSSGGSAVLDRSMARLITFGNISDDESVSFRWVSHVRLLENINNLGIGSFTDLYFYSYFKSYDPWLMMVNPHSFLAEMSFLYGYIGLFLAFCFVGFVVFDLIKSGARLHFVILFVVSIGFFQMIPSSVLGNPVFFVLCIIFCLGDLPNNSQDFKSNKIFCDLEITNKSAR